MSHASLAGVNVDGSGTTPYPQQKEFNMPTPSVEWSLARYLTESYALDRAITQGTEYLMGVSVRTFERWLGRAPLIQDLTEFTVSRFLRDLEASRSFSQKTISGRRGDLLAIWRHAADRGLIDPPRRVRIVKVPEPMPTAWTPAEMAALLKAAKALTGYLSNGLPRGRYFHDLLRTAYETGLRRSDLLKLKMRSVDDRGVCVVLQRKTGRAHACAVRPETLESLRWLAKRLEENGEARADQPLWWPYTPRQLYHWIKKICRAAGVRDGALQQARRTGATHAERAAPGTAARYLGHATDSQAKRHYIDQSQAYGPVVPPRIDEA